MSIAVHPKPKPLADASVSFDWGMAQAAALRRRSTMPGATEDGLDHERIAELLEAAAATHLSQVRYQISGLMEELLLWFATNHDSDPRNIDNMFYAAFFAYDYYKQSMRSALEAELDVLWRKAIGDVAEQVQPLGQGGPVTGLGHPVISGHLTPPGEKPRPGRRPGRLGLVVDRCPLTLDQLTSNFELMPAASELLRLMTADTPDHISRDASRVDPA